ncbi:MAG: 30S ribosomal protein S5 [Patescibacteria group bacterium]
MDEEKDIKEKVEETIAQEGADLVAPTEEVVADIVEAPLVVEEVKASPQIGGQKRNLSRDSNRRGGRGKRFSRREERVKPEFDQKIVSVRRVTRVVAGGRRMSFSVSVVAGNKHGKVGVGVGKAGDTALAIDKAFRDAKKNMIVVTLTKSNSIPHDVKAKYSASVVTLSPSRGRGLVAGGSVRNVLELAGITDISGKLLSRSKNGINNARATIKALSMLHLRKKQIK